MYTTAATYGTEQNRMIFGEKSDHLGNVRAVVSDIRKPASTTGSIDDWTWQADVRFSANYYDGVGMIMPGSLYEGDGYRFGAQGSEVEKEIDGTRNWITTYYRQANLKTMRWSSPDPKANASWSPYAMMNGNPVWFNDPLGDTIRFRKLRVKNIEYNKEGGIKNIEYGFKGNISERRKERLISKFKEKSLPVLESMSKTSIGQEAIDDMIGMPTLIKIKILNRGGGKTDAGTYGNRFTLTEGGYMQKATIKFFQKEINKTKLYSSTDEAYHAIGIHEKIHLEPAQIRLDKKAILGNIMYLDAEANTTYKRQFEAIKLYWSKYGRTKTSNKAEEFFNTIFDKTVIWE